jgi:hypothetical protein
VPHRCGVRFALFPLFRSLSPSSCPPAPALFLSLSAVNVWCFLALLLLLLLFWRHSVDVLFLALKMSGERRISLLLTGLAASLDLLVYQVVYAFMKHFLVTKQCKRTLLKAVCCSCFQLQRPSISYWCFFYSLTSSTPVVLLLRYWCRMPDNKKQNMCFGFENSQGVICTVACHVSTSCY